MATPELSISAAAQLYGRLGYDGIEIIFQEDYECAVSAKTSSATLAKLRTDIESAGLQVVGLVPYANAFNSLESTRRAAAMAEIEASIYAGAYLGARCIRVLPGEPRGVDDHESSLAVMVETLSELADQALSMKLNLVIENHMETAITNAAEMVTLVERIGHEAVGVLYDPANLKVMGEDDDEAAFRLQRGHIRHVHLNDFRIKRSAHESRKLVPGSGVFSQVILGEGDTDWRSWIGWLAETRYSGFITAEYGTRWFADTLLPPELGLAHELRTIKRTFQMAREKMSM